MTTYTEAVQIRRITYGGQTQPLTAVTGDDISDNTPADVLDPVMKYNPFWSITGYHWDWALGYQVAN